MFETDKELRLSDTDNPLTVRTFKWGKAFNCSTANRKPGKCNLVKNGKEEHV